MKSKEITASEPKVIYQQAGLKTRSITLDNESSYNAWCIGNTNVSLGIRQALASVDDLVIARARVLGNGCAITGLRMALDIAEERKSNRRPPHTIAPS